MRTPIIDGRSIEQFIPTNLRGMFYQNPIPQYRYAIHDGYDPYGFSTNGLVLYLPLWALEGSSIKSVDAYKHTTTVTTATWKPKGRDFTPGTPDYILVADNSAFDFTDDDFTIALWVNVDDLSNNRMVWMRGTRNTDGIEAQIAINGRFNIRTSQAAATQVTRANVGTITTGSWFLMGYTRVGTSIKCYSQGLDVTDAGQAGTHTNPVSTSTTGKIGIDQNLSGTPMDGMIGEFIIWNRALTPLEMQAHYITTKWRYQ